MYSGRIRRLVKENMQTFQASIVKRFLKDKAFDSFVDEYKNARYTNLVIREPTDMDRRVYKKFQELKSFSQTARWAKKFGNWSQWKVQGAIARVAAYGK